MATLAQTAKTSHPEGHHFYVTPRVPQGLASAVESLTREIIRNRPEDIYVFAAHHFEKLLQLRQEHVSNNEKCSNLNLMEPTIRYTQNSYQTNILQDSVIVSLPKSQKCKQQQNESPMDEERLIAEAEVKSPPRIITGMQTKDIKTELRKNRISSREKHDNVKNKVVTNLNMEKVKEDVIKKLVTSTCVEELQKINYVPKVQAIIDENGPIIQSKMNILRKHRKASGQDLSNSNRALEAQLNETCNLLKDISSCFSKPATRRPRSADAATNTVYRSAVGLEAMLNETRNLLVDISSNFFKQNPSQGFTKSDDNGNSDTSSVSSLPAVKSPSTTVANKNIPRCDSSTFALPPVLVNSNVDMPKSVKTKEDLTLPELAFLSESKSNDEIIPVNTEPTAEISEPLTALNEPQSCSTYYVLSDVLSPDKIPDNVTTVIIPDSRVADSNDPTSHFLDDHELLNQFGEVVEPEPDHLGSESFVELVSLKSNKMVVSKHDLQCINEEEIIEEHDKNCPVIDTSKVTPELKLNLELDIETEDSERSSSAKETSITDGPIATPKNCQQTDTGLSSTSTDAIESSNEAKESTITDGVSLSFDDPARPFVPELNLDSLQDLTISSFKMTGDEYEQPDDNDNSATESSAVSLYCHTAEDEEKMLMVVDDFCPDEELMKVKILDAQVTVIQNNYEPATSERDSNADEEMPLAVSRSASECTTRRINSGNSAFLKEYKESVVDESDEFREISDEEHIVSDTEKKASENIEGSAGDEPTESSSEGQEVGDEDNVIPDAPMNELEEKIITNVSPIDTVVDEKSLTIDDKSTDLIPQDNLHLIAAVTILQAGIRGFLARRHIQKAIPNITVNSLEVSDARDISNTNEKMQEETLTDEQGAQAVVHEENTIAEATESHKLKKRLYRENAMQKNTTISMERFDNYNETTESGVRHTGEFHDCIPLPLFDTISLKPAVKSQEAQPPVIEGSEAFPLMGLNLENKTSPSGLPVFQLNPAMGGILNLFLLANGTNSQGYNNTPISSPLESPSSGVIIEEILNTDAGGCHKDNQEIVPETQESELNDSLSAASSKSPDLSVTALQLPRHSMPSTSQDTSIQYGSEEFSRLVKHHSIPEMQQTLIIHNPLRSSLSLSQESLSFLLGDDRLESPITMMQIIPSRSESLNSSNNDKKDEDNNSQQSTLQSPSTNAEDEIKSDAKDSDK